MTAGFGWQLANSFPSADLAEPLRQRATNFVVFSLFIVRAALNVTGFIVGIATIGVAVFAAMKGLRKPPAARNR
jgi:hypothetical protein